MKKSKIILGCIISVIAFALTLLIGLPHKVYASEVSDYIEENYSNLVISNNLLNNADESILYDAIYTTDITAENDEIKVISLTDNFLTKYGLIKMSLDTNTIYSYSVSGYNSFFERVALFKKGTENDAELGGGFYGVRISENLEDTFNTNEENEFYLLVYLKSDTLNGDYTTINVMLNKGSTSLPYEPYITGSMIYEQAFNKGVEEATNNNGIWKYIRNVYVGTEEDNNYNLSELKSRGFLSGYEMNLYSMSLVANESYSTIYIDFEFTSAPLTELDFFFKGYNSYTMNIYDEDGEAVNIDVSSLTSLNYEDILQKNSNFGNYIDTISIVASSPDALDIILNNSSYSEGFQNGYSGGFISGKNEGYSQGFNAGLQDEANNKVHYEDGYEDGSISGYNQGYNEGASSNIEINGIKTLFNSILSYPVNLISNVLDFEFMGINIASLVMFVVSIGVVMFVVKKFW